MPLQYINHGKVNVDKVMCIPYLCENDLKNQKVVNYFQQDQINMILKLNERIL